MIVMKFGGASIGTPERIKHVAQIIKDRLELKPVVVASAFKGVTNELIKAAENALAGTVDVSVLRQLHAKFCNDLGVRTDLVEYLFDELEQLLTGVKLVKELTPRSLDYVTSFGEISSVKIIAEYFSTINVPAKALAGWEVGIITDKEFTKARPLSNIENAIYENIADIEELPIVTGFIGKNKDGEITTLGRNGSDLTATLIGSAINADEVQIWRDVTGVMTADPALCKNAKPIAELGFEEAAELAYYGSKILHPSALIPAVCKNIPVRVLNMFKPEEPGTQIVKIVSDKSNIVKSIAYRKGQIILNITSMQMLMQSGFLARVFEIFGRNKVVIDVVATSEVSISLTTDTIDGLNEAIKELSEFSDVKIDTEKALIAVIGKGLKEQLGIAGRIFQIVSETGVNVELISFGASKVNLAFLVREDDVEKTVQAIHSQFFAKKSEI